MGRGTAAPAAVVQTAFDFAIREINALETRIVKAEDAADDMLWEQARQVVALRQAGHTQRQIAAQWFNARGEAYSKTHVVITEKVFGHFNDQPRPRFRELYNAITNAAPAHVSQNTGNHEWYTPQEYIDAATAVLGGIDLDPASCAEANAVVGAKTFYTIKDNGLEQRWRGRVWMNPPYAQPAIEHFAAKLADSVTVRDVTAAVVLVNNATETDWFRMISDVAAAVCFPAGRVRFWSADREAATPLQGQAVLYVGEHLERFREAFGPFGVVLVKPGL